MLNMEEKSITLSCSREPALLRLGKWCDLAGYLSTKVHYLERRHIAETVLIYCVSGKGWMKLSKKHFEIKEGDLFFCPPYIPHGYGCDPDCGWRLWWTHCGGDMIDEFCKEAGFSNKHPIVKIGIRDDVIVCFRKLVDLLKTQNKKTAWDAAIVLDELFINLIRLNKTSNRAFGNDNLIALIDENCKSLDELAEKAGYSKYHFSRLFKKQTGRSPWQMVIERKIEKAKEMLLGTHLTVKEIASELDFEHPDYFARMFNRHTGVNPKKYRGSFSR